MSKPFDKMIKSELEEAAQFLKLEDAVKAIAKDATKPTNAEYVKVLEEFKAKQDADNADVAKEVAEEPEVQSGSKEITPKSTKAEEIVTKSMDYATGIPVIVTDHDTSIAVEEDMEGRTFAITWGNPVIGMSTTNVPLHGRMQYLPKGAVIRLKRIPRASHIKDAGGKEQSHRDTMRFSVSDTTGWTEAQFDTHKQEQLLKRI